MNAQRTERTNKWMYERMQIINKLTENLYRYITKEII